MRNKRSIRCDRRASASGARGRVHIAPALHGAGVLSGLSGGVAQAVVGLIVREYRWRLLLKEG